MKWLRFLLSFFFKIYICIFFPFLILSPVTDKIARYFFVRALNRIELCATRQSMFHTHASELFLYFYWFSFCRQHARAHTHIVELFLYIYMLCLMDFEKCIEHIESSEFHMRFSLSCTVVVIQGFYCSSFFFSWDEMAGFEMLSSVKNVMYP